MLLAVLKLGWVGWESLLKEAGKKGRVGGRVLVMILVTGGESAPEPSKGQTSRPLGPHSLTSGECGQRSTLSSASGVLSLRTHSLPHPCTFLPPFLASSKN